MTTFQECDLGKQAKDLQNIVLDSLPVEMRPSDGMLQHIPYVAGLHSWYYYVKPAKAIFGGNKTEC